ncbi:two-component system sensor histidine kinase YesM [Ruminiclostridium sufflavum DSM 19573]|uniref:Two-component system sensor histidine kinase YesM n=1 Tax=Ruminiclostridium sufflavum DSM 19573 TaxID=1121337 RepID=A0A318XL53_9FIRM|nr:sensor histidine kinase [Ruminiclostridium sufflavum]PYG88248.1 two-component system sensor histidine kinase YesM [Ruminiclostridium sufflavum DSM 19573]
MNKFKKFIDFLMFYKRMPIKYKITSAVVAIVLFPMCLTGFYFYWNTSSMLTDSAYDNMNQLIEQTSDNLRDSFRIIDNTLFYFASNRIIRSWASDDQSYSGNSKYDLFIKKSEIEAELKYSMLFNDAWDSELITTAYLFIDKSNFCSISRLEGNINIINQDNIKIYETVNIGTSRKMKIVPPSPENHVIYNVRNISKLNTPRQYLKLIIGTEEKIIFQKYSKILEFPKSRAFIMDNDGTIYSHPDKSMLGKTVEKEILDLYNSDQQKEGFVSLNSEAFIMAFKKIDNTDLIFVAGIPQKQVLVGLYGSMKNYLFITLLIFIICIIFSILISVKLNVFIKHLLYCINSVKNGNYEIKMPVYQDKDLNLLSSTFNSMTGEIKYLINQVYENELLLRKTEFKFLQSQMNPHFLFNTLVTIGWKAKMSDNQTIYNMVTSLSNLLQASIYADSKTKIPIRQELEYIKFYLYLQGIRFEDRLEYKINICNEEVLNYLIPKLCAEPIVENAVVHGIENKIGKGIVEINIKQYDSSIYFEIIDNGIGFENPVTLEDCEPPVDRQKKHNNIGLRNTNKRIKLLYGSQYGISIESELNQNTKVTIHIPVDRREDFDV